MTTWHIEKTGEHNYHVHGGDEFMRIEEDADGPKLTGMLHNKGLTDPQIGEVLSSLDAREVGYRMTVTFKPPSARAA